MSIGNLSFSFTSVTVSYLIRYDSLLQNATDIITKCVRFFITKCDSYYKMRRLLQIATVQGIYFGKKKTLPRFLLSFMYMFNFIEKRIQDLVKCYLE